MDQRKFVFDTGYNIFYKVTGIVFPLIASIYVSRVLFADGIGKVSSAQNVVAYFTFVAALGIPNYGIREIAKRSERNKVFWELFLINAVSTTLCVVCYYILIQNVDGFKAELVLYHVVGLGIVFNYFNVDWFFYGCQKYDYIAIRSFVIKVLSFAALLVIVRNQDDYIKYALIICLASGANGIFNIVNLHKERISLPRGKNLELKRHLSPIFILLATTVSIEIYTLLDMTMLVMWTNDVCVGLYANAGKLIKTVIVLVTSVSGAVFPQLVAMYEEKRYVDCGKMVSFIFEALFVCAVPCGIGIFVVAPLAVPLLFGKSFMGAVSTVRILSFLMLALAFSNLFGTQVLLTTRNEKKVLGATVLGAAINIVLNVLLIPIYKQDGAAVASVISEGAVTLVTYGFARRCFEIKIRGKVISRTIISSGLMTLVVMAIDLMAGHQILSLALQIVWGALIYCMLNWLLKNPVFIRLLVACKSGRDDFRKVLITDEENSIWAKGDGGNNE